MTNTQRMKNDIETINHRETQDKAISDHRVRNDDLTKERRFKADKTMENNRVRNDELTVNRRISRDGNSGMAKAISFLIVLAVILVTVIIFN